MAVNTVAVVGPQLKQREERAPKESTMDKVFRGLQVAGSVAGTASSVQNIRGESTKMDESKMRMEAMKRRMAASEEY